MPDERWSDLETIRDVFASTENQEGNGMATRSLWAQAWSDDDFSIHEKKDIGEFLDDSSEEGTLPVGKPFKITAETERPLYVAEGLWVSSLGDNDRRTVGAAIAAARREQAASPKARIKNQGKRAASAFALGVGMGVADEAGELMLDTARHFAKAWPFIDSMLAHPEGREGVKLLMALFVQTVALQTNIPHGEGVARLAELQMTVSGLKLSKPVLAELRKLIQGLAGIASTLDLDSIERLSADPFSGLLEGGDSDSSAAAQGAGTTRARARGRALR